MTKRLLFGLLLFAMQVKAQESRSDSERSKRAQFIPLPVIYYTPETKLGYGLLGVSLFRTDSTTRTSNVDFAIIHTLNRQTVVEPTYTVFTHREHYLLRGMFLYTQFPEFYYGIGNETTDSQKELISYKSLRAYNRFLRQVRPRLFVGLQQQYFKTFDVNRSSETPFPTNTLIGGLGSVVNGVGVAAVLDTRDNIYSPSRGWYADVSSMLYNQTLGSQFTFTNYTVDIRRYKSLSPRTVLALQGFANLNVGEVPFKLAATLGGSFLLRGYYNGRYRDNNALAFQAEVRQRLLGRLGGTVFASAGNVANVLREFSPLEWKVAGGAGLRYLISRKEHLNLRFDVAVGQQTHGIYVNISEAF
ncbi:BamA/TamA family outer membrane protein [Spirosoma sp. HMF4905]|uniref:BamA/TamA family outer membrane protein n=1 Tax=Spirosoma arboris TaxID=2682092 RepID=A0A7K1SBK0_9BACT|nr:BamA/TamA family outer membrane protein [Spirosoma arboris]MVM30936.1 BamA/TamA family outer membrane protein [Spirosoma arboris]